MRKTCVQLEGTVGTTHLFSQYFSTLSPTPLTRPWNNPQVLPVYLHNFIIHFYSCALRLLTEVSTGFSTLSTPLIIRAMQVNKEKQLIGQGG